MSTTIAPPPVLPHRKRSASEIALWVLGVAAFAKVPGLLSFAVLLLAKPWITIPLLVLASAWHWRPAHTKRALLTGVLLAHQQVTQRRQGQPKTDTAEVPAA